MLCTFCPPTILSDFYRIPEKSPKSSADKMNRACESKDQTLKKIRTLHFPDFRISTPRSFKVSMRCACESPLLQLARRALSICPGQGSIQGGWQRKKLACWGPSVSLPLPSGFAGVTSILAMPGPFCGRVTCDNLPNSIFLRMSNGRELCIVQGVLLTHCQLALQPLSPGSCDPDA